MKKFTLPALILIALSACSLSQKKAEVISFEKGPTDIITTYPNATDAISVSYNEINQIVKTSSTESSFASYTYGETGLPIKAEFYFDNVLDHYKSIAWLNDSVTIANVFISGSDTTENARETYIFNATKEMTQITQYKKDSLGVWQKYGSKYEFEWINGNLMKIKCLVPKEYLYDDSTIMEQQNEDKSLTELSQIADQTIKEGYTLFYESTYTYDDKNNPYQKTSLAQLILPNKNNISTNNPLTINKKYSTGEDIKFELSYEYNDKGYPTISHVNIASNIEGFEKMEYTREFNY